MKSKITSIVEWAIIAMALGLGVVIVWGLMFVVAMVG